MKKSLPLFSLFMVYLTEVATFCNFFMFFASTEHYNYSRIEFWPWLALSALVFWGLAWLLKTPRDLSLVIGVTVLCALVTLAVMSLWFVHVTTLWGWGFGLIFLCCTTARAPLILLQGCESRGLMLNCELPILGICFLLWMNSFDVFFLPPYYMVCTIGILLLTILALSMARMSSERGGQIHTVGVVGTVAAAFAILGAVAALFVRFASFFATTAVGTTSAALSWLYTAVTTAIMAFFVWFASLFPESEVDSSYGFEAVTEVEVGEMATVAPQTALVASVIVVALIVYLLVRIFLALRKKKFGTGVRAVRYHRPKQKVEKVSIKDKLRAFFRRIYGALSFQITVFLRRNTPQGAVIVLSKIGKKRGLGRRQGESYHGYLQRLAPLCATVDAKAGDGLERLATALDATLYAPAQTPVSPISTGDHRRIRRALTKLHRPLRRPTTTTPSL